jgi:tRNA-dihydrouridine synthase C
MLTQTGCDALMIGRGSVINPFIFHGIKAHFAGIPFQNTWENFLIFLNTFIEDIPDEMTQRGQLNKLKQLFGFLFKRNPLLLDQRQVILTSSHHDAASFLAFALPLYQRAFD